MRSFKFPQVMCVLALLVGGLVLPSDARAQHHRGRVVVAVGYPYYSPFYWGSYWGSPFWGPYGYWPAYGYYGGYYDYASQIRVMATPREAEVYVDGYLVGTVDDFDGWSQRLRIQPGEHEIELYLEGHRSVRQKMLFRPGETYKIRAALEKIAQGDEPPVRPAPAPGAAPATWARLPAATGSRLSASAAILWAPDGAARFRDACDSRATSRCHRRRGRRAVGSSRGRSAPQRGVVGGDAPGGGAEGRPQDVRQQRAGARGRRHDAERQPAGGAMTMSAMTTSRVFGTAILSICFGASALAQTAGPPASPAQPTSIAQPGQLTIERVEHGFVFAPDARVTEVNGETAALAGGYVGWMTDRTWLVGAGGYWLANQDDDLKMAYGGMVVEYLARSQERIGFGVRGLVGGGSATLGSTVGEYFGVDGDIGLPRGDLGRDQRGPHGARRAGPARRRVVSDRCRHGDPGTRYFFVVEPQASVIWHITRWARLDLGVGYRLTAGAGNLDENLRGPSASVAVQFGGGSRKP